MIAFALRKSLIIQKLNKVDFNFNQSLWLFNFIRFIYLFHNWNGHIHKKPKMTKNHLMIIDQAVIRPAIESFNELAV